MKKSLAFTLAEVLITLAIIGVVAAMTIPSVIVNTNQQEFKTGLRKAVSVLNSSITMNLALEGETPYDNNDLFTFLQQHMSILKSTTNLEFNQNRNRAFYTTDGMRFEIPKPGSETLSDLRLHENPNTKVNFNLAPTTGDKTNNIGNCGSEADGLANLNNTKRPPCMIMVDVNGDRKPNPANINQTTQDEGNGKGGYKHPLPADKLLTDVFTIMITDEKAIPFGVAAQKAMYQSNKK